MSAAGGLRLLCFFIATSLPCFATAEDVFFPPIPVLPSDFRPSLLLSLLRQDPLPQDSVRLDRSTVHSFHPRDPSPTLASAPFGISQVRFLESDALEIQPVSPHSSNVETQPIPLQASVLAKVSARSVDAQFVTGNNAAVLQGNQDQDRWPWPSIQTNRQTSGRQLKPQQQQPIELSNNIKPQASITVSKSVPKPYRIISRVSSCPKLNHDLVVSCQVPQQQPRDQIVVS